MVTGQTGWLKSEKFFVLRWDKLHRQYKPEPVLFLTWLKMKEKKKISCSVIIWHRKRLKGDRLRLKMQNRSCGCVCFCVLKSQNCIQRRSANMMPLMFTSLEELLWPSSTTVRIRDRALKINLPAPVSPQLKCKCQVFYHTCVTRQSCVMCAHPYFQDESETHREKKWHYPGELRAPETLTAFRRRRVCCCI